MAGYKQSIIHHNPVMFITFDGDPYDSFTRKLTAIPETFQDETPYQNHGILRNELEDFPAYRMGLPSIVEMEPGDQNSISFGWYGRQPTAPNDWPKAFIEVPHQQHLELDENEGSFTVSLLYNRESDEKEWRDIEWAKVPQGAWNSTLVRPIIRKAGVFNMWYQDNWLTTDTLHVTHPGGSMQWTMQPWFYNNTVHIAFTWDMREVEADQFEATATLYFNGRVVIQQHFDYFDSHPSSTSSAPIEIAGTINQGGATNADRATSKTIYDQIFLLNKSLSADELMTLYKKVYSYDRLIFHSRPSFYWTMSDNESAVNTTMVDFMGNRNGVYLGGVTQVLRQAESPPKLPGGRSVQFLNGGTAAVHSLNSQNWYQPVMNPTGDFAVEFWVRFENSNRSVLFSMQRDDSPYNGILIQANMRNGTNVPGHIQLNINQTEILSSRQTRDNGQPFNFSDGQFHHVVANRRGANVQLWIDGIEHDQRDIPISPITNPGPGQIYLMGAMPGNLNTNGYMSKVALYALSLDPQEIRARNIYSVIYRIQGTVTLQGNPHRATIRAINHRTGELVREVLSDNNSGDYTINLYDNTLIDLMALNKQDRNIRYRVYGPIAPAVFNDLP